MWAQQERGAGSLKSPRNEGGKGWGSFFCKASSSHFMDAVVAGFFERDASDRRETSPSEHILGACSLVASATSSSRVGTTPTDLD